MRAIRGERTPEQSDIVMSRTEMKRPGGEIVSPSLDAVTALSKGYNVAAVIAGATLPEIALHMGWGLPTAAKMVEIYSTLDPDLSDSVLIKLDQIRNKNVE